MTISHPPGLADVPAELPSRAHIGETVRLVECGECCALPGRPCDAPDGYHLARFVRAVSAGLLTGPVVVLVLAEAGPVFTSATVIRDGSR